MKKKILGLTLALGLALSTFTAYASDLKPMQNTSIAVGEVTGDNKPDIVYLCKDYYLTEWGPRRYIAVKENLGGGVYKTHKLDVTIRAFTDGSEVYLQIEDMDGDGLNDIIAKVGNYMRIFKNKGDLKFEEKRL